MSGNVLWITGYPGSGKTTLAKCLIQQSQFEAVLLDGDELRKALNNHDYSLEGRKSLSFQYARLAKLLADQGLFVVVSVVALFNDIHTWNRANIKNYKEVFLNPSLEVLQQRNKMGLYGTSEYFDKVLSGAERYQTPQQPDLILDSGLLSIESTSKIVLDFISHSMPNSNSQ